MVNLTELISDLVAATDQMKPAAQGDDWDMVERLRLSRMQRAYRDSGHS